MDGVEGTVYLLHFVDKDGNSARYGHAAHYLGWAWDLNERLKQHRSGRTSPLIRAALDAGLDFVVARTWEDVDRNFERSLKNRGSSVRFCPRCQKEGCGR